MDKNLACLQKLTTGLYKISVNKLIQVAIFFLMGPFNCKVGNKCNQVHALTTIVSSTEQVFLVHSKSGDYP